MVLWFLPIVSSIFLWTCFSIYLLLCFFLLCYFLNSEGQSDSASFLGIMLSVDSILMTTFYLQNHIQRKDHSTLQFERRVHLCLLLACFWQLSLPWEKGCKFWVLHWGDHQVRILQTFFCRQRRVVWWQGRFWEIMRYRWHIADCYDFYEIWRWQKLVHDTAIQEWSWWSWLFLWWSRYLWFLVLLFSIWICDIFFISWLRSWWISWSEELGWCWCLISVTTVRLRMSPLYLWWGGMCTLFTQLCRKKCWTEEPFCCRFIHILRKVKGFIEKELKGQVLRFVIDHLQIISFVMNQICSDFMRVLRVISIMLTTWVGRERKVSRVSWNQLFLIIVDCQVIFKRLCRRLWFFDWVWLLTFCQTHYHFPRPPTNLSRADRRKSSHLDQVQMF